MKSFLTSIAIVLLGIFALQPVLAKTPISFQICSVKDPSFNVANKCFTFDCEVRRKEYDRIVSAKKVCISQCSGSYFMLQACERKSCDKQIRFKDIAIDPSRTLPKCDQIRWYMQNIH